MGVTVTVTIVVQPPYPLYVISLVPAVTPVTIPAGEIVATPVLDEDHGGLLLPEPTNASVAPTQTEAVVIEAPPLVNDTVGSGVMVKLSVAVESQPYEVIKLSIYTPGEEYVFKPNT